MKKNRSINCPAPHAASEFRCNLLVSAVVAVTSYDGDADVENDILNKAVGHFHHYSLLDILFDEGVKMTADNGWKAEKFDSVEVTAEIWAKAEITLPFDPSRKLSQDQQHHVHSTVAEALVATIDAAYEPSILDVEIWLTDAAGMPTIYLTGLLDVLEGRLSQRKLKHFTEEARQLIPHKLFASNQAA